MVNFCTHCGTKVEPGASFCKLCGSRLVVDTQTPLVKRGSTGEKKNFNWPWVFKSAGLVSITVICSIILLAIVLIYKGADYRNEQALVIPGLLLFVCSIFIGTIWSAYLSPGRTIYEPAVGSVLVVTLMNLLLGNIAGILLGWVLPFLIGIGGAKIGERLQKNRK